MAEDAVSYEPLSLLTANFTGNLAIFAGDSVGGTLTGELFGTKSMHWQQFGTGNFRESWELQGNAFAKLRFALPSLRLHS
jgi:hypothetical protein